MSFSHEIFLLSSNNRKDEVRRTRTTIFLCLYHFFLSSAVTAKRVPYLTRRRGLNKEQKGSRHNKMTPNNFLIYLLVSLIRLHVVSAKRDTGIDYDANLFVSQDHPKPAGKTKRFIVSHKSKDDQPDRGDSQQINGDCKKAGGKIVQVHDDLGLTVIEFANETDATTFASLGHSSEMEEDFPRYLMRIKGSKPSDESERDAIGDLVMRKLQRYSQVIP